MDTGSVVSTAISPSLAALRQILLPSVVASKREQVAADAIRTAFHPTTPGFEGLIDRFLADREQLLKGPYVLEALPFHQGTGRDWFPQIPLP